MIKLAIPIIALLVMLACSKPQSAVVDTAPATKPEPHTSSVKQVTQGVASQAFAELEPATGETSPQQASSAKPAVSSQPTPPVEAHPPAPATPQIQEALPEGWVEATGECYVANITPEEAEENAWGHARRNAIEQSGVVEIRRQEISLRSETIKEFQASFTSLSQANFYGKIVEEKKLGKTIDKVSLSSGESTLLCRVTLRARVAKEAGKSDPSFQVTLKLNNQTFREGEEIILSIKPTQDSFITVFNILSDHTVLILHPPKGHTQPIKGGQTFMLPSEAERQGGVHFRVGLLPGKTSDTEGVFVFATKDNTPFFPRELKAFTPDSAMFSGKVVLPTYQTALEELNRWLVSIPLDERTFDVQQYEIKKK